MNIYRLIQFVPLLGQNLKSKKLYKIYGEKINAALEMFEYKIEENTDDKLVSVYKVKETVDSIIRVFKRIL